MKDIRLIVNSVLLALPAMALTLAGGYFLVDKVPELERQEKRRVQNEYRELAVQAKESGAGEYFDFKASGYQKEGKTIQKEPWGFERGLVWYIKDGASYRLDVEPVKETNFRWLFYPAVTLTLICLFVLTAVGIRYFWRFLKTRDDFMAATAHDLTTPLVGMRRMIGRNDEEAKRLNERMLLLVDNIKNFLKLGGRRKEPDLKPIDIVALTREAYALFAADYEDSEGGSVIFSSSSLISHSSSLHAVADDSMLLQILWNLFGNDLKYAAPYGKVEVRFSSDEKQVTVEFVDEGPGMTPRQMRKAFDRYYRAKTVLESGKGGFGIGLCTAREFARAMGGDLTVRANSPNGCIFALRLMRCACDRH